MSAAFGTNAKRVESAYLSITRRAANSGSLPEPS